MSPMLVANRLQAKRRHAIDTDVEGERRRVTDSILNHPTVFCPRLGYAGSAAHLTRREIPRYAGRKRRTQRVRQRTITTTRSRQRERIDLLTLHPTLVTYRLRTKARQ